jgi:hypothetical protein
VFLGEEEEKKTRGMNHGGTKDTEKAEEDRGEPGNMETRNEK